MAFLLALLTLGPRGVAATIGRLFVYVPAMVIGAVTWFGAIALVAVPFQWLGLIHLIDGPPLYVLMLAAVLLAGWAMLRWIRFARPFLRRMDEIESPSKPLVDIPRESLVPAEHRVDPSELAALDARLAPPPGIVAAASDLREGIPQQPDR